MTNKRNLIVFGIIAILCVSVMAYSFFGIVNEAKEMLHQN